MASSTLDAVEISLRFDALPSSTEIDPPLSLGNLYNGGAADDSLLRTKYNHYAGMEGLRCAAMPDTRTHKQITHKATKKLFHNASRGKCAGRACLLDIVICPAFFLFLEDKDSAHNNPFLTVCIYDIGNDAQNIQPQSQSTSGNACATLFNKSTTQKQKIEIMNRSIHLFLRHHGPWVVTATGGSYRFFENICGMLPAYWVNMKQYDWALDISIIKADVSIMTGQPDKTIYHNIMDVAKCLEAMGRMKDAAHMYHALAETEPRIQSIDLLNACYNYAGVAFKYAGDFDMAESMFIRSVYDKLVAGTFTFSKALFELYLNVEKESKTRTGGTFELGVIYGSLSKACGFNYPDKELNEGIERHCCVEYLKPALQKPAAALAALNAMATSPDRDLYRKMLQECKSTSTKIKKLSFEEKDRNDHKKHARKTIKSYSKGVFVIECDNTECKAYQTPDGQNLGQCGCRSVAYCSRACQKSHWKIHKKSCPLNKQKNGTEGK